MKPIPATHVREREVAAGEEDEHGVNRMLHGLFRVSGSFIVVAGGVGAEVALEPALFLK